MKLTHQPRVTDERAGRSAGVSIAQQSYGGNNVKAPRRPRRFAHWLRGNAYFMLAMYWLLAELRAQDFPYTIVNGQLTIVGYTGLGGDITIPETIQGLPVTHIADAAFAGPVIPPRMASVTIPNSVIYIGAHAFVGCTRLVSVFIPESVTFIGSGAFQSCTSLTSIMVDARNPSYSSLDGVLFNKDRTTLIQYPGGKSREYAVPMSVTNIGDEAFSYCTLASVTFPNSVTSIGDAAFDGCTELASLAIPNSVTSIGQWTFRGCTRLASVTIPSSVTFIGGYAFAGCTRLASVTIPNSVTNIGNAWFAGCAGLASVTIPNSVTGISNEAFSYCTSLTSVTIPNSVDRIGDAAFAGCTSLASVTIPNSVIYIGRAFWGCTSLPSVTIPDSVTSIGYYAFRGCTRLRSVHFMGDAPVDKAPFDRSDRVTVYYRAGTTGWRSIFSGRPAVLWIPEDDLDCDDMTNLQEFLAGTDPADAQSLLAFEGAPRLNDLADEDRTALPPGQFALYFQSIPGQSYEIQFTKTLGAAWSQAATAAAGRSTQKRVVLNRPAANGFYRLKLAAAD